MKRQARDGVSAVVCEVPTPAARSVVDQTARDILAAHGVASVSIWLRDRDAEPVARALATDGGDSLGEPLSLALETAGETFGRIDVHARTPLAAEARADLEARARRLADVLASARATSEAESEPRGTILVADDDPAIRSLLRLVLSKRGFTVVDVENGEKALAQVAQSRPDLILIDWVMPVLDGPATVRRLKADHATRDIPVVMLTSQSHVDEKVAALEAGVQDFVLKPFESRELVARLEQQLRWRNLLADVPAPAPGPPGPAANAGLARDALARHLGEAEAREKAGAYESAALAYAAASEHALRAGNADLANKLLRLSGKMYLTWAETAQDAAGIQAGYLAAARCFLDAGNIQLAKRSIDFAYARDAQAS